MAILENPKDITARHAQLYQQVLAGSAEAALEMLALTRGQIRQICSYHEFPPKEVRSWYIPWLISNANSPLLAHYRSQGQSLDGLNVYHLKQHQPTDEQWFLLGQDNSLRPLLLNSTDVPLDVRRRLLPLVADPVQVLTNLGPLMDMLKTEPTRMTAALLGSEVNIIGTLYRDRQVGELLAYLGYIPESHGLLTSAQRNRLPLLHKWPQAVKDPASVPAEELLTMIGWRIYNSNVQWYIRMVCGVDLNEVRERAAKERVLQPTKDVVWPTANFTLPRGKVVVQGGVIHLPSHNAWFHRVHTSQYILIPSDPRALVNDTVHYLEQEGFICYTLHDLFGYVSSAQPQDPINIQLIHAMGYASKDTINHRELANVCAAMDPEDQPVLARILAALTFSDVAQLSALAEIDQTAHGRAKPDRLQDITYCIAKFLVPAGITPPPYVTAYLC